MGDRANDRVRVDATRGAGAGGRRGRQPRADAAGPASSTGRRGGLVNTDAVDNSGGVDMSDHEVNIKILLDLLVQQRRHPGPGGAQRDPRGDDRRGVGPGAGRQRQPGAARSTPRRPAQRAPATRSSWRSSRTWSRRGIAEPRGRRGARRRTSCSRARTRERGLPRPLLCVLLGHVKNWAFQLLLESTCPDSDVGRAVPRRLLPDAAARALRRALRASTRCGARSSRPAPSTTWSTTAASACCRG